MAVKDLLAGEKLAAMDSDMTLVMPDSWHGHARRTIADSDLSGQAEAFAAELTENLLEKHDDLPADAVAEKAISATRKRFD
jgi:hypothetical protein